MKAHEYWRDTTTGKVWAIELTDGVVTAACGPLRAGEVNRDFLEGLDYSAEGADRIELARSRFTLISDNELLLLSAETD